MTSTHRVITAVLRWPVRRGVAASIAAGLTAGAVAGSSAYAAPTTQRSDGPKAALQSPPGDSFERLGQLGGRVAGMQVDGDVAWVEVTHEGERVAFALDLKRQPDLPVLGAFPLDRYGPLLAAVDGRLVAAVALESRTSYRLTILDTTVPAIVRERGHLDLPMPPSGAVVDRGRLYTTLGGAVAVIDISDPDRPLLVGRGEALDLAPPLAFDGRHVYATWSDGYRPDPHAPFTFSRLHAVDVLIPSRPVAAGRVELPWAATIHQPATIRSLSWKDGFLFAGTNSYQDGVAVFDVRDAARPALVTSLAAGDVQATALDGRWLHVVQPTTLRTYDVTTPLSPTLVGSWPAPVIWQSVARAAVTAGRLAVADSSSDVRVIDVRDPAAPRDAAAYQPPNQLRGFAQSGNVLFATDDNGAFRTFDVLVPERPRALGILDGQFFGSGIAVRDDVAYIAAHTFGLRLVDVADPDRPRLLAVLDDVQLPLDVALDGTTLVVTAKDAVIAYDVATARAPRLVGRLAVAGAAWLRVRAGLAYVTTSSGLTIADVRDPSAMRVVGALGLGQGAWGPELVGSHMTAIVGFTDHSELRVINIADPERPRLAGQLALPSHVQAAHRALDTLLVSFSDGQRSLAVIDLTDPRRPLTVDSLAAVDARAIGDRGDVLFVGSSGNGLVTYRFRPVGRAVVTASATASSTGTVRPAATVTTIGASGGRRLLLPWLGAR